MPMTAMRQYHLWAVGGTAWRRTPIRRMKPSAIEASALIDTSGAAWGSGNVMHISKISTGDNPPQDLSAAIEIPAGDSYAKYEFDKTSSALFVCRFLHTTMRYPGDRRLRAASNRDVRRRQATRHPGQCAKARLGGPIPRRRAVVGGHRVADCVLQRPRRGVGRRATSTADEIVGIAGSLDGLPGHDDTQPVGMESPFKRPLG
jgi:hypothetical protein